MDKQLFEPHLFNDRLSWTHRRALPAWIDEQFAAPEYEKWDFMMPHYANTYDLNSMGHDTFVIVLAQHRMRRFCSADDETHYTSTQIVSFFDLCEQVAIAAIKMEHTKLDKAMIPHERANLIDDLFKEYILMRTRCATAGIYRNYIFDEGFLWDWFYCGLRYGPEDPEKANCLDLLIAGHESHALTFARTGSSPEWALTGIPVAPSHDPNPSGKFKTPMELRAVQREGSPEEKAQQPSNRHSHVPKRRSMSSRYSHVFDSIKRKSMTGIPN